MGEKGRGGTIGRSVRGGCVLRAVTLHHVLHLLSEQLSTIGQNSLSQRESLPPSLLRLPDRPLFPQSLPRLPNRLPLLRPTHARTPPLLPFPLSPQGVAAGDDVPRRIPRPLPILPLRNLPQGHPSLTVHKDSLRTDH